uniref:Pre-mRNA-processing factor 6 n=1 Tax=Parastrongyloides trichosuri TaxID=131310 RepID=A0A0N4ZT01_PARTI
MSTFIPGSLVDKNRKHFWNQPAPEGYVPGIGRGDFGFTTRSDIGPAKAAGIPGPDDKLPPFKKPKDEEDSAEINDSNFNDFFGYSGSLVARDPYEKDDEEADLIYQAIDDRLDERRKDHRQKIALEAKESFRKELPDFHQQFSDLTRQLASISESEWLAIPDVGDARNKAKRNPRSDKFTPVPDSIIASSMSFGQTTSVMDPTVQNGMTSVINGTETTFKVPSNDLDLVKIGQAKNRIMDIHLNKASDSVSGQTVIDPKGYITGLQSMIPQHGADIADIKKARQLLKSVRETNPYHPPAWIAGARLEEVAGKMQLARNLIMEGADKNPKSEDLWIEAVRLHPSETAKKILANAVCYLPLSVRIWLKAADIEKENKAKKKVLRKALENIPTSVVLWKTAVELEEPEEARQLLTRAVECCPTSTELWLALSKLETYENARKVLNKAREHIPTERQIWIHAAKLEETKGNAAMVDKIIDRAITSLKANMVEINRSQWIKDAIDCEKAGCLKTCKAIIRNVLPIGVEEVDRRETWLGDADHFVKENAFGCARGVYDILLDKFEKDKFIWETSTNFERVHGTTETYLSLLKRAVEEVPKFEVVWLMYANCVWKEGNVDEARNILSQAFENNSNSESIWLAAFQLESENGEFSKARKLLKKARESTDSPRIWMKSAKFEWCLGNLNNAKDLLLLSLDKFVNYPKLYMMLGQLYIEEGQYNEARKVFTNGIRKNVNCPILWILLSRLEESQDQLIKARSDLEKARLKNPKNPLLWLESIRLEWRANLKELAKERLSRALQECENSGILWAEAIFMEDRHGRRNKSLDALKKCDTDPDVLLAIAKLFWAERRVKKARDWFQKSLKINPDNGDTWAYFYKFELLHGTENEQNMVLEKCIKTEPRHGELWQPVLKNYKNWKKKTGDILKIVTSQLEIPK